jgi:hypothetical protein
MRRRLTICVVLFVASFAIRVVVWQNNKVEMATVQSVVTANYLRDARALASGDIRTFLSGDDPPVNARVIDHPPGYPLAIGVVSAVAGESSWRLVQIGLNSLAAVFLFLIAAQLLGELVGVVTGCLAALSPQLAYHSGMLLPDELSVIPILAAVWLLTGDAPSRQLRTAVFCGVLLGISCWLRSNAMLLPVFAAAAALATLDKAVRLRFAIVLLAAFGLTVIPITIRNAVYFHAFVPLSLGGGTTFVEGLGDLDNGTRGLPVTDQDVMALDERLELEAGIRVGGPYSGLYDPNGVERDARRMSFGRKVVAQEPVWFIAGVAKRGLSTFRLERVPAIAAERDEYATTNAIYYWPGRALKFVQRVFITAIILPLALLGSILLAIRKKWRVLLVLLVVPVYFATVQALVHTEYRYVIATAHFALVLVAFALVWSWKKILGRDVNGLTASE